MIKQSHHARRGWRIRSVAALSVMGVGALGLSACTPAAEDDGVITIFAPQNAQQDLETNAFTLLMEEKFDVDLQFQTTSYESSSAAEARQIALASGDLPDAFMLINWVDQFSQTELLRYGEQGLILPLNDLITSYGPDIEAAFDETPESERLATAPDGKVWGLPMWNDCYHCSYPAKFWINSDWLEAVGMAMPTTPDEMFDVLMAFKNEDPNGNGEADEIPLTTQDSSPFLHFFMNAFIYSGFSNDLQPWSLGLDGDTVQIQATQDAWREGLVYLNKLWENGLIDPAAFSNTADALLSTGNSAAAPIVGGATVLHPGMFVTIGQEDGRDQAYEPVPPLSGPAGDVTSYVLSSFPGATFVITNKASENKQRVLIEIMNYLHTNEGHVRAEFGEEGIGWVAPEDGDLALDESLEPSFRDLPLDEDNPEDYNGMWWTLGQYNTTEEFRNAQVQPLEIYEQSGYERRLFEATKLYEGKESDAVFPYWNVWVPVEVSSELSTMQVNINSYLDSSSAEFITGTRDPNSDTDWQAYLDGLNGLGADRYIEIWQDAYDAAK